MTPEQHKAYTEACNAFGEALERIFSTTKNKEEERQKAREIIDKYKREGILKDKPKAPTMERQEHNHINDALNYQQSKRDWEILEFGNKSRIFTRQESGRWYIAPGEYYQHNEVTLLASEPIHSVRRLADNTVWTVGDELVNSEFPDTWPGKIRSFNVQGNNIWANTREDMCNHSLERWSKPEKKPLFTTADGVQIFNNAENVYNFYKHGVEQWKYLRAPKDSTLYATRDAAEKAYDEWLYTQPVLSIWDFDGCSETGEALTVKLKQLVKEKIAKR